MLKKLFLIIILLNSACFLSEQKPTQTTPTPQPSPIEQNFSVPQSNINLQKPLEVSKLPEDVAVSQKISQIIDSSEFANARWGIIAISLKDGRIAVARDAQKLFSPASIQKLLTSIVALDKLGADFRWKTSVISSNQIESDGTLNGDLVLYGQGSPDYDTEGLKNLLNQLEAKGLKRVKGNIIGDESFFKGDTLGDGWTWSEIQWYYGAEASALTFNENQITLNLNNNKPTTSTKFVQLSGETKPVQDIEAVGVKRGLSDNNIYVWGNGNSLDSRLSVYNPSLWAATALKEALESRGIKIEGEAKSVDWKSSEKTDVNNANELAKVDSKTLGEIIRKMNKDSVNLYAELILRTLGKKFGETAPNDNPKVQKLRGDDSAGASVIAKWLKDNNISSDEIAVHDGSGLSRLDFVSPEVFGKALVFANQAKFAENFKDSLPISGTDGTLRGRLQNLRGKVLAKTGSIMYVNSLAGFVNSSNGETYAFAIVANNETRKNDCSPIIDAIVTTLNR
ncbi:MAG: D-alanyl-D-alanine carboxypeptidase/D-alanyl-D-alanine-endopeptidase [Pyrinomonadaceae bacterium]|jgi:D-alanyl-D-alanine carboxypeptidase/D-alanyl-D-alanine-endopeptidase (penicillin-binding protein 4)|nr:D-alanyl-D-alanine carboxypeptidase/D-alanyl-D-alanine-endopeptidase [Pyrinomonadaceae bacterium]